MNNNKLDIHMVPRIEQLSPCESRQNLELIL
jgi:hypothetical protein